MNTNMSLSSPNFGSRVLTLVVVCGLATAAHAGNLAHSDVPDLPSAVPPKISGGNGDWERPEGKTRIDFKGGPASVTDISREIIESENAPPPALTSTRGPDEPFGGSFVPASATPPSAWSGTVFVNPTTSSVPAPGALFLFGLAGAAASRRRR